MPRFLFCFGIACLLITMARTPAAAQYLPGFDQKPVPAFSSETQKSLQQFFVEKVDNFERVRIHNEKNKERYTYLINKFAATQAEYVNRNGASIHVVLSPSYPLSPEFMQLRQQAKSYPWMDKLRFGGQPALLVQGTTDIGLYVQYNGTMVAVWAQRGLISRDRLISFARQMNFDALP